MTTDLHVETSGDGPAVVLVHSSGLSGRQWRRLVPALAQRGLRAVVPDLTGHGASPPWPEPDPFTFRTDVERVAALLGAEGPAHLVGHSYGGLVALHAALAAPAAVRTITVYDPVTFGVLDRREDAAELAAVNAVAHRWGTTPEEHEAWLQRFVDFWGGAGAWKALREDARAEFQRVGWVVREGVRTLAEDATPAEAFAAITAPTHLITGELTPAPAQKVVERLGEAMPNAETTEVPALGHMAPVMAADTVNPLIVEWIVES